MNKMIILASLLTVFLFQSCAGGLSKKEIAERKVMRENNSKLLTEFFINKVWNVPIKELMKDAVSKKVSYKPNQEDNAYVTMTERLSFTRGEKIKIPVAHNLSAYIARKLNYKSKTHKKYKYSIRLVYKINGRNRELKHEPHGALQVVHLEHFMTRLMNLGFPIKKGDNCYYEAEYRYYNYKCIIDSRAHSNGEHRVASFRMTRMYEKYLNYFEFLGLNISPEEEEFSFAEIYKTRMEDPGYAKFIKGEKDKIIRQIRGYAQRRREKAARESAKNKAYHRAIKQKFKRMGGEPRKSAPYNPYKKTIFSAPKFYNPVVNQDQFYLQKLRSRKSAPKVQKGVPVAKIRDKKKLEKQRPAVCPPIFGWFDASLGPKSTAADRAKSRSKEMANRQNQLMKLSRTCQEKAKKQWACSDSSSCRNRPGPGTLK